MSRHPRLSKALGVIVAWEVTSELVSAAVDGVKYRLLRAGVKPLLSLSPDVRSDCTALLTECRDRGYDSREAVSITVDVLSNEYISHYNRSKS